MARPRTFERSHALDAALTAFWNNGYEATSLHDLVAVTGVCKASLYSTFGTKDDLYQECLAQYRSAETERLAEVLDTEHLGDALAALFELLAQRSDVDAGGCFVVNAAMERTANSPATNAQVYEQLADLVRLVRNRLERAVDDGELDAAADVQALADFVVSSIQGMRVVGKIHHDADRLRAVGALVAAVFTTPGR